MEGTMIRAIFFDYDGVLTTDKSGSLTTYRYFSEASGIPVPTLSAAFAPYEGDLLTGRTCHAEIWSRACEAIGQPLDIGLLERAFESTPVNAGMLSLADGLRRNYSVGIITDNKKDRMDHLRKHQGLDALFDPIVVSAEVGNGKRSEEIFRLAMSRAGVVADGCIFIDNSEANLVVAGALGMHVIFHDDEKNDIGALRHTLASMGVRLG
jgi:HAD superfamily hydrolase (TIGR01509 family)